MGVNAVIPRPFAVIPSEARILARNDRSGFLHSLLDYLIEFLISKRR